MSGGWTLGNIFVLRHAGFPFDWLEELGISPATRASFDAVLAAEERLRALSPAASPQARAQLEEALRRGAAPKNPSPLPAGWKEAVADWQARRAAAQTGWTEDRAGLRARLHARAGDEGVQGAVFLSNPSVYENSWRRYAQEPLRPENSDSRRLDRQAYTYLQRLCGKNETTSFFGPMGYGEILPDDRVSLAVVPSGDSRRRTFLALWAVTELARAIQRDPALRAELPLRLNPMFELTSTHARCQPLGLEAPLDPVAQRLVALLQAGPHSYRTASAQLQLTPGDLERSTVPLLKVAFLLRGLAFPTHDFNTLEALAAAVAALPASAVREGWTAQLDSFQSLLRAFQEGTLEERRVGLSRLEALFTRLTGKPARRGEGGVYEDRLIIYEEAASPFALQLGKSFGARLGAALEDGLEVSAGFGEALQQGHRQQLARQLGPEGEMDFLSYTLRTRPAEVAGTRFSPVPPLPTPDCGPVSRLSAQDFAPSTPGARYSLPDVCLGGALPEAGEAPRVQVLLARVHHHLLLYGWLAAFHPRPDQFRAVSRRFVDHEPDARGLTALAVRRRNKGFYVYPGRSLLQSVTDVDQLSARTLSPTQARVRLTPQGPALFSPEGDPLQLYFPLDDFSKFPPFAALSHPQVVHASLRSDTGHTPRIELGEAVYQRELWDLPTAPLAGLTGLDLHLAVHRARRRLGLPRFVYGRTPAERKPYLFDLESPFAMELLRHVIAQVDTVSFVEMLPSPEQLFLRDGRGRYTFELRMQAERWTTPPPASGNAVVDPQTHC